MNQNLLSLARVLLDKNVTEVPLRVLRELRTKGIKRLPDEYDSLLGRSVPKLKFLSFLKQWLGSEFLTRHDGKWVLNSFFPPFPGIAFERAFTNLLSGRRFSPMSAFLSVTTECPYHCWHCSTATRRPGNLTTEQWLSTIGQLQGLGVSIVGFTGGEPTTRDDLPQLVEAAAGHGAATIVFSSGANLTEELGRRLKQAGLWSLCISLDEPFRDTYDRLRGAEGAYDRAIAALRLSRQNGFYTMIGAVATRHFVEERLFVPLYDLAGSLDVDELRIVEPMPCGKLKEEQEALLLTDAHTTTLREFHRTTNRKGKRPKVCAFNQIESPEVFGCAGGIQHLYIDAAGAVCPCDFTPLSFGSVTDEPLAAIWERMNTALKQPRCNCMLQTHHKLFSKYYDKGYPIDKETSVAICKEMGDEGLPGYYEMVMRK